MNHLPNSSFLQSRPARIELARQRFFEKGQAPTGVVGQAVFDVRPHVLVRHRAGGRLATCLPAQCISQMVGSPIPADRTAE